MNRSLIALTVVAVLVSAASLAPAGSGTKKDGWISMFNGKDLTGWKVSENKESVKVEDGLFVVHGKRAHAFYVGKDGKADFTNFEFHAKVMTKPKANSGIYFHTEYQEKGWPGKGYECQVNQTHKDRKKTGGLYAVKDVLDNSPAKDGEWYDYNIKVVGKRIIIKINGKVTCDFTEPDDWDRGGRKIDHGTIAIQAHDPGSIVYYKDIRIRKLP